MNNRLNLVLFILVVIGACLRGLHSMEIKDSSTKETIMKTSAEPDTEDLIGVIKRPAWFDRISGMPSNACIFFKPDRICICYGTSYECYKIFYNISDSYKLSKTTLQSRNQLTITLSSTKFCKDGYLPPFKTQPSCIFTFLNGWKILFHKQVCETSITIEIYRDEILDHFKNCQVFTAKSDPWSNVVTLEDSLGNIYDICIRKIGFQSFLYQDSYGQSLAQSNFGSLKGTYFKFTLDDCDYFATIDRNNWLLYMVVPIEIDATETKGLAWFHGIPNMPPNACVYFQPDSINIYYNILGKNYEVSYRFAGLYKLTRTLLQGANQLVIPLSSTDVNKNGASISFTPRRTFILPLLNGWKILFQEQKSQNSVTIEIRKNETLDSFKNCQVFTARKDANSDMVILKDSSNRRYMIFISRIIFKNHLLFQSNSPQSPILSNFSLLKGTYFRFILDGYDYYATIDGNNRLFWTATHRRFFTD